MKRRLLTTLGVAVLVFTITVQADEQGAKAKKDRPTAPEIKGDTKVLVDDTATRHVQLKRAFESFRQRLAIMAGRLENGTDKDKEKAKSLRKALKTASDMGTEAKFDSLIRELTKSGADQSIDVLRQAVRDNTELRQDLQRLIALLTKDDSQLNKEQMEKHARMLERIKELIAKQERVRAQTEVGRRSDKDLGRDQNKVTKETGDLIGKEGKSGDDKKGEFKPDGKPGLDGRGEARGDTKSKGEGKPSEGKDQKAGEGKPGESKDGKPGEGKPGESKDGKPGEKKDDKPGEGKPGESKSAEAKPGESKAGEGKPSSSKGQGEGKGEAKPGKPGEDKPSDGKPGQGKSGEGKPGSGKPGQSGQQQPPQEQPEQEDTPVKKQIEEANKYQKQAEIDLDKAKKPDAADKMTQAIKELEAAKKKLEDLLKQMREEEIERLLADLEKRCRYMLAIQIEVRDDTVALDKDILKNVEKKPTLVQAGRSNKLADKEDEIVREAHGALKLIKSEGSAVAFAEVFEQVGKDMEDVRNRLSRVTTDAVTRQIEDDIIETLKEMIAALQKAQREAKQGKPSKGGSPQDQKLIDQLAELKMIFAMQRRVNARTELYGKQYTGEQAPVPELAKTAKEREHYELIQRELKDLAGRQQKIGKVTHDIATGKNESK